MSGELSLELIQAVQAADGGPVQIDSGGNSFVLMSLDTYRNLKGEETEADLAESVAAVQRGLEDIGAGRTRSFRDALDDLGRARDVQR